ncbi:MAG: PspC domain-containing protein [Bdellovibrionales bacterium]
MKTNNIFIRRDGVFGGVCGGLAFKLGVPVLILRIALWISFLCTFGLTFLIYLSAVVAFPSELTVNFGDQPKFLGVCHNLAPKLGVHETWLRFVTLVSWILTGFVPIFAVYMILFLVNAATDNGEIDSSGMRDVN